MGLSQRSSDGHAWECHGYMRGHCDEIEISCKRYKIWDRTRGDTGINGGRDTGRREKGCVIREKLSLSRNLTRGEFGRLRDEQMLPGSSQQFTLLQETEQTHERKEVNRTCDRVFFVVAFCFFYLFLCLFVCLFVCFILFVFTVMEGRGLRQKRKRLIAGSRMVRTSK